ncbi:purine-nucleoside phosphorylase [Sneathiella sp. CAU 1612]|uniref:Purine nucleoside phosphorylase n=1 Tax=Sneathiella sedimenti TaxID=2816034 RepID=A0ABS3F6Q6_9PROT|nr:purine-nucleoside phosphorylase [Sneathiella sedimenti]MBO0334207.1 purine-nucleoside phosphorylase [Sneathiella sedimenti]
MTLDPHKAADFVKNSAPGFAPRVGIVLGSGLGGLAEKIETIATIDYESIPDFPISSVEGHAGRLILGRLGGMPVACMQGRVHYYEGVNPPDLALPVRMLKLLGVEILLLTNAAGSFRKKMGPGSLMMIKDHINFTGLNPLVGPNDDEFGPRFFSMENAYDPTLRKHLSAVAKELGITLHEGVYLHYLGPNFETPAEIQAFKTLGPDAVGMSTTPEVLVARHCGLRVAAISNITNLAAGMSKTQLSHEQTLECAKIAAADLESLVIVFLETLKRELLKVHIRSTENGID